MNGFTPGLFDRLMDTHARATPSGTLLRLSLDEMKDAVVRDLEDLLNTRSVIAQSFLKKYPECGKSIVAYGLNDFAGLSLSSTNDRAYICRCLEHAINRHEPRLSNVRVSLDIREGAINCLTFAIAALLRLNSAQEPVNFDAVLQPSSLYYTINRAHRAPPAGI